MNQNQVELVYVERAAGQAILEKAMLLQKLDQLTIENARLRAELERLETAKEK